MKNLSYPEESIEILTGNRKGERTLRVNVDGKCVLHIDNIWDCVDITYQEDAILKSNVLAYKLTKIKSLITDNPPLCCPYCESEEPHHEEECVLVDLRKNIDSALVELGGG